MSEAERSEAQRVIARSQHNPQRERIDRISSMLFISNRDTDTNRLELCFPPKQAPASPQASMPAIHHLFRAVLHC